MGVRNHSGLRVAKRGGRKVFVIDFRYRDSEGREQRYRRDARVQRLADARAEAAKLQRIAAERGSLEAPAEVPTLEAFVRGPFTELFMLRLKPSTRAGYKKLLFKPRGGLVAMFGKRRLDTIDRADARALEGATLARGALPRHVVGLLSTVLREAVELGVLSHRPTLPSLSKPRKLPDAPTAEHVGRMLEGASGWLRIAIALGAFAGLRMGEMRALEVGDVDLVHGVVHVRRGFSEKELAIPKGADEATIPLLPQLASLLEKAVRGKGPRERVVTLKDGTTPSDRTVDKALRSLQRRLEIEPVRSHHKLRHYFGTALVRGGAHIEAVRKLMRHRDLSSTSRYVHAVAGDLREAISYLAVAPYAGVSRSAEEMASL